MGTQTEKVTTMIGINHESYPTLSMVKLAEIGFLSPAAFLKRLAFNDQSVCRTTLQFINLES